MTSLLSAFLLVACLLNAALIVRFYRHCFSESVTQGKDYVNLLVSKSLPVQGAAPILTDVGSQLTEAPPPVDAELRALLDGKAAQIMAQGFSTPLGLTEKMLRVDDKNELERIWMKGSLLFQQLLHEKQIEQCRRGVKVDIYQLNHNHRYGFFSQVHGTAHSLLDAFAHDHVLSWSKSVTYYVDKTKCASQSFECLFLPITSCADSHARSVKTELRNSCMFEYPRDKLYKAAFPPANQSEWKDMLVVLRDKSGLGALGYPELFNAQFFVREALRFVMRPNARLQVATQAILKRHFPLYGEWRPFRTTITRISVHIRAGDDKKYQTGVLGPEFYVRAIRRITPNNPKQVLVSSDDDRFQSDFAAMLLNETSGCDGPGSSQVQILTIPVEEFGSVASVTSQVSGLNKVAAYDTGTLLSAQAFVFAGADAFLGFFGSNVATTIAALMSSLRFNSQQTPAFDVGGSPWCVCHSLSRYPLRNLKHPILK